MRTQECRSPAGLRLREIELWTTQQAPQARRPPPRCDARYGPAHARIWSARPWARAGSGSRWRRASSARCTTRASTSRKSAIWGSSWPTMPASGRSSRAATTPSSGWIRIFRPRRSRTGTSVSASVCGSAPTRGATFCCSTWNSMATSRCGPMRCYPPVWAKTRTAMSPGRANGMGAGRCGRSRGPSRSRCSAATRPGGRRWNGAR